MSFFSTESLALQPDSERLVAQCGACGLFRLCHSPKMPPSGKGKRKILIIAEAPGKDEDAQGTQLIGISGQKLEEVLRRVGIDMRRDCWLHNALICHPKGQHGNRKPTQEEIGYCRPNVTKAVKELNPVVIITLGGVALESLVRPLWRDDSGFPVERWVGWQIPCQKLNTWICPTYHPSYLLRESSPLLDLFFEDHLRKAVALVDARPWEKLPEYEKRVDVLFDQKEAAERIMLMTECSGDRAIAIDYETNMLKPDSKLAQILCCSMSDGRRAIAFPWHGKAEMACLEFIKSDVPKIASNLKFEERWTKRLHGHGMTNWYWDTMIAAHVLDCRRGISGLKFQSFVQFGQPSYSTAVEPLMRGFPSNSPNRLKDADQHKLMLYCGMDAMLEHKLATKQISMFEDAAT
jgi:DNA polymerase